MNKSIITIMFATLLALSLLAGVSAQQVPLWIDRVEIDDQELFQWDLNELSLERDETYEVEVRFTPFQDLDNAEIRVSVAGYEYNDLERIEDWTHTFDADAGVTYTKRLRVKFPLDIQEDEYLLRLSVRDRNSVAVSQDYRLKLDVPRHRLHVEDVYFHPAGPVKAGDALLTTVRLENKGERNEDDVRVSISVPALGLTGVDYIEEIEVEEEVETEEIFLRIPACTAAGVYDMEVRVEFDELTERMSAPQKVIVEANPKCGVKAEKRSDVNDQLALMLKQAQEARSAELAGDAEVEPVEEVDSSALSTVRKAMEIVIFLLVGLLVVMGLIFGFVHMAKKEEF